MGRGLRYPSPGRITGEARSELQGQPFARASGAQIRRPPATPSSFPRNPPDTYGMGSSAPAAPFDPRVPAPPIGTPPRPRACGRVLVSDRSSPLRSREIAASSKVTPSGPQPYSDSPRWPYEGHRRPGSSSASYLAEDPPALRRRPAW